MLNANQIQEIVGKLKNTDKKLQRMELDDYPLETLEGMAVYLYEKNIFLSKRNPEEVRLLNFVLRVRENLLNSNFQWNEETKKQFLRISDTLTETFEKAFDEAIQVGNSLKERISQNDKFLSDYEIDIKLNLYLKDSFQNEDGETIGIVLSEPISDYYPISTSISHYNYKERKEECIYLDKTVNWNIEFFGNVFDNDYIGYAIHALLDSGYWSFVDILNINKIWADVCVRYQHFKDLD